MSPSTKFRTQKTAVEVGADAEKQIPALPKKVRNGAARIHLGVGLDRDERLWLFRKRLARSWCNK